MTKEQALEIIGNKPREELKKLYNLVSILPEFHSEQDKKRLEAIKVLLKKV